jgi:signal transduction histidine kinase
MFGWCADEVIGRPPPFVPPDDTPRARDLFARAFDGSILADVQIERRTRSGEPIHVSLSSAPLKAADGSASVLLVLADVTERRRAQEELIQAKAAAESANRAKSDFLASMSHELRTPLNAVIGFTRVLMRNKTGNLSASDTLYLDRIAANGQHLLGLITDILDLSKIEAGRMEVERERVRLDDLVRDTVAQLEVRTSSSDVQLVADIPDELAEIDSDPNRLRQVLINLIGNAIKFTPAGDVHVRVVARAGSNVPIRIDVIDSGIGIAPERLGHIFDAFEQAERTTSRRYGGTGLGLSISRGLCRMLGYELTVTSSVGIGSTFSIDLEPLPDRPA